MDVACPWIWRRAIVKFVRATLSVVRVACRGAVVSDIGRDCVAQCNCNKYVSITANRTAFFPILFSLSFFFYFRAWTKIFCCHYLICRWPLKKRTSYDWG